MTSEELETTIRDCRVGVSVTNPNADELTVRIKAGAGRKDDFEAIREAVREVLDE